MKKVLLSCLAIAAGTAMAVAQGEASYPSSLDFTLNGEKELEGVTVNQTMKPYDGSECLTIEIKGEYGAEAITMDFETPTGWDYALIDTPTDGENSPFMTRSSRSNHWVPVKDVISMGYKKGNSFIFPVNEKENLATIYLVKEEKVWEYSIDISFKVSKAVSGDEPGEDPVFPESFIVKTFNEGLDVTQGMNWGVYDINVTGEVTANTFPIIIDIPEGWDGFICYNWSKEGDVTITENNQSQRGTRAEEIEWIPVEGLLDKGYVKGNRFTFEPTYNPKYNNEQTVEIRLYKGDMAMKDYFNLTVAVTKGEISAPEFPSEFDVTATGNDVTLWQGAIAELPEGTLTEDESYLAIEMFHSDYAIMVSGKTTTDSTTVEFNLPEGWAGVQPFKINVPNYDDYEYLRTRANESDWQMLDEVKESLGNMYGYFDTSMEGGNKFEFDANGKQVYLCYLYTDMVDADETVKLADTANPFLLVVDVMPEGSRVDSVDSAAKARFFNLQGAEIANPNPGIYVKVINGKSYKVVVK